MPRVTFQTDVQGKRFRDLQAELLHAQRVVQEHADPMIARRDRLRDAILSAAREIGMPAGVQVFVVKSDGIYFPGPDQVWDQELGAFVDPPRDESPPPAKKAAKKASKKSGRKASGRGRNR